MVERTSLVHGCLGELWRGMSFPVLVADDDFTGDGGLVEACGSHEVVVLGFLVCESKVDGMLNSNIIESIVVGLPCLHDVDNLVLAIAFCVFAIDEDTIGPARDRPLSNNFLRVVWDLVYQSPTRTLNSITWSVKNMMQSH
ncbi:L-ascorbate oxidase-like protein [Senna tora]|uniref:L-ascorbate oxidase-like protein n=1 Tax=Senna tora TaxID=362788 RepID=A0A834T4A4_9FABA|nr:L-ascorbate oxidase-like protein [Senna tora]